ncbi:MAG: NAD(P)-binding protein [Lachnospiraceae bacterium]|nr:NAD(P)-binding protein [Lachnospiraceae bacterium]
MSESVSSAGGPAGTSMAMYLEKNGYYNYVIYEKSNKVGGKAFSPLMKDALLNSHENENGGT